ncbi:MAG TPA: glycosyltransferase family 1 protein [Planctomycetota bacterium]|nr:glycosyltransferase family 1 protein [Planctomycetota bacterium]
MTTGVGLDLTCLEAALETGVERYARRLAETLPIAARDLRIHVIVREGKPAPSVPEPGVVITAPASFSRVLWRETVLPATVRSAGLKVLHAPVAAVSTLISVPRVATIHDVPDPRAPGEGGLFSRHRLRIHHAMAAAKKLITPSFATRDALLKLDPSAGDRIAVIPHGVDPDFRPWGPSLDRARYGIPPGPYVLCVATLRPRKDHDTLLRAFARVAAGRDLRLVLAGRHDEDPSALRELAAELGVADRVLAIGYVARQDLPDLYREASAAALASRIEGFGLPILEAMACGVPVAASEAGAVPEVAGGAARLFEPGNVESAASALRDVLDDAGLRATLKDRGLKRAAEFTWEACARRHADVYRSLIA